MRDSVVFYRSFYDAIKDLPDDQLAKSFKAIMEYGLNGNEPDTNGLEKTIYLLTKPQIDANNKRYLNGTKGGRPPKHSESDASEAKKCRNSQEYIKWRDAVYERDNYMCAVCGEINHIEAHHKKGFVEFPELRYEISNGITLCEKCHKQVHKLNNQNISGSNLEITENNLDITGSEPKEKDKEKVKDKEKDKNTMCVANALFERLWKLYPNKKGKGQVSDTQKKRLLAIGEPTLVKAIERYSLELQKDADWRKPQNGSTFFNSGYEDYLDGNYVPGESKPKVKKNAFAASCPQRNYNMDDLERQLLSR